MSRAVDEHVARVPAAQRRRVVGPAERRERPQRRREPRVEHVGRLLPAVALGPRRPAPRSEPSGANQTGSRWPHHSWREMHQGRIDSIQSKKIFSSRFGWNVMRPLRTASIAVAASSSILQNHCSETIGSTRAPERWQKPTEWCSGSSATIRPSARSCASAASWPSLEREPLPLRLQVAQPALLVHEQQRLEPVVAADLEVESDRGRASPSARPCRSRARRGRRPRSAPAGRPAARSRCGRSGGSSAGRRDAPRRRCRPGSSPAARSRSRSRRRPRRRSAPSTARRRPRGARPRGRRWRSGAATTSSRGGCRGRCTRARAGARTPRSRPARSRRPS